MRTAILSTRCRGLSRGLAVLLLLVACTPTAHAAKRDREIDHIDTNPNLPSIRLTAVAMLPAASYDNVGPAERHAEGELMKAIRGSGYRWITAPTTRDRLRDSGGDSLLKVVRERVLKSDTLGAALASDLCARLRVNGLITVLVERASQISIQSDQSGKPSTSVQVRAVLMDSLGTRVWRASGSEVLEGPEAQAQAAGGAGGESRGLTPTSTQPRDNAPEWPLAYQPLFLRWAPTFPPRSSMAGGAPADSTAR